MRALSVKQASRAPSNNIDKVSFIARRNQHGLVTGDVTSDMMKLPVQTVQRLMSHGIVTCDPASNFKVWGKDVASWLLKNHREHPVTMKELIKAQTAMADDDVDAIPVSAAWVASEKMRADEEARKFFEDSDGKTAAERHAKEAESIAAFRAELAAKAEIAANTARKAAGLPVDEDSDGEDGEATDQPSGEVEDGSDAPLVSVTKPRRSKRK